MRKVSLLIALLAVACDEDNPARHLDGGSVDSPKQEIDAPVVPKPVSVTVKSVGIGQEGVTVHFQNADSTLVATETTDATGVASHLMGAGGYVTVINPFPAAPAGLPQGPRYDIRTFAGVKPGDELRVEETAGIETPPVSMTFTLPPQTDPNIYHYDILSSCGANTIDYSGSGGSNPSASVAFYNCTTADVLVLARDEANQPYKFFFVANQTITTDATIDYTNKTLADVTDRMYTLGDLPTGIGGLNVRQYIATTRGPLVDYSRSSVNATPATATIKLPVIPNGVSLVEIDGRSSSMQHISLEWGALAATPYTTDFAARKLVDVTNYSYDIAAHTASWTAANGVTPDFVSIYVSGDRYTSTDYRPVQWTLVAPYTAASATFPTLPAGTFDLNFTANDSANVGGITVGHVPGGYDTVRAAWFAIDPVNTPQDIAVGPTGTAQLGYTALSVARTKKAVPAKKTLLQHRTQSTH